MCHLLPALAEPLCQSFEERWPSWKGIHSANILSESDLSDIYLLRGVLMRLYEDEDVLTTLPNHNVDTFILQYDQTVGILSTPTPQVFLKYFLILDVAYATLDWGLTTLLSQIHHNKVIQ